MNVTIINLPIPAKLVLMHIHNKSDEINKYIENKKTKLHKYVKSFHGSQKVKVKFYCHSITRYKSKLMKMKSKKFNLNGMIVKCLTKKFDIEGEK